MFQFSGVRQSAILIVFLSISHAFSVTDSKHGRMKLMPRPDDDGESAASAEAEADEANEVYGPNRSPVAAGPVQHFGTDQEPSKTDGDWKWKIFKPEAEYLLTIGKRKWKQDLQKIDFQLRNKNSVSNDLHLILKKISKEKSVIDQRKKLKYLNHDRFNDQEKHFQNDDDSDEEKVTEQDEEDDLGSWASVDQLEKDYVHVARSTSGFARQAKRSSASSSSSSGSLQAVVDVLVVVDNALYRRALQRNREAHAKAIQDIKRYYGLVISLVDARYSQIENDDFSIRIRLAGIFIARDKSESPWSEGHTRTVKHSLVLDPNVGLEKFQEWLKDEHRKLPKFDHAMAFTGYSLVTAAGKHTSGMAYIGTVCKISEGYACSIIQEDGGLSSVSTAVHELGHSLGAKHDGEGSNAVCQASQNYIMAPGNSAEKDLLKNFFIFSPCTIREFKASLSNTEDVECLFDSSPDKMTTLPGQEISPDEQCKDVFGQDSGFCEIDETQSPDEICSRLWCVKPGKAESCVTRGHLTAVLGTSCAPGKVCKTGQCLDKVQVLESLKGTKSSRGNHSAGVQNRVSSAPRSHRPNVATEKPVKIELGRPKCKEDTGPEYCRMTVYKRPDLCQRSDMAAYCCFSCSFV